VPACTWPVQCQSPVLSKGSFLNRHGLRPTELVTLRWDAIDFSHGQIRVSRTKNGSPSVHPLSGVELREQDPHSPVGVTLTGSVNRRPSG
jgi:integrase